MMDKIRCFTIKHNYAKHPILEALDLEDEEYYYMHFGPKDWIELFDMEIVVEVELEIIPDDKVIETDYYGFYNFKDDGVLPVEEGLGNHPAVYSGKELLDLHYNGVQSEVDRGRGKIVRIRVTEVENEL